MKSQHAAGNTVSADHKSVAGACERTAERLKMTRECKESSTTTPTAAFLAPMTEWDDFKSRLVALALENQCIPRLAIELK